MFGLSWHEFLIIGVIAILLFGKRLPEVAKSLGGSYREFKRGLSEFHSQLEAPETSTSSYRATAAAAPRDIDDYEEASAPRFEPPPAEPAPPDSATKPTTGH